MKTSKLFISLIIICYFQLIVKNSYSQINPVWNDIFNGYWDSKLVSDQAGNCYIQYFVFGTISDSVKLIKYNPTGQKLWDQVVYVDTVQATNLSYENFYIDDLGFPIIQFSSVGATSSEHFLLKCDTSGNFIWKTETEIVGTCVFNQGNIYFSGHYASDMSLYKYNSSGALVFKTSRPFTSGSYGPSPLIDTFKNSYFFYDDTTWKAYKVDTSGLIIDSLFLNLNLQHLPILDSQNYLLIGDKIDYPSSGQPDSSKIIFRKYDTSFDLLYESDEFSFGYINQIIIDNSDNIYIETLYPLTQGIPLELKIIKLNTNGILQWTRSFGIVNGFTKHYDARILMKPDNNLIIVGEYYPNGYVPQTNSLTNMIFLSEIDSSGILNEYEEYTGNQNLNISPWPSLANNHIQLGLKYSLTDETHIFDFCIDCTNFLSGYIYFDADGSCNLDSVEYGLNHAIVEILPDSIYLLSDSSGFYHAYLSDNSYDISSSPYLNFQNSCAVNIQNITISNGVPVQDVNFGKYINPNVTDIFIDMGRGPVRPGFNTSFTINFQNRGGSIQSGVINFIPENFFSFIQASYTPIFLGGDTIQWPFINLLPGESRNINIILNCPPSIIPGTPFNNHAEIFSTGIDVNPVDNFAFDQAIVTGFWDPNNKIVIPAGLGSEGYITTNDSILHYTINFENYGNDTAFTVIVIDTLDQDLDISTLIVGSVSHTYTLELIHSRILRFRFNNILLTDTSNLNENYGFINFSIEQKNGLQIGTEISNCADIYFDYNLPVKTGTTLNTLFEPTAVNEINASEDILIFPNPAFTQLSIQFKQNLSKNNSIELYTAYGQKIQTFDYTNFAGNDFIKTIDISKLATGVYFLKLEGNNSIEKKFVKF